MQYALILNNAVKQIYVADDPAILPISAEEAEAGAFYTPAHTNVYIGCPYEDGQFVGVVEPEPEPEPEPVPEPDSPEYLAMVKARALRILREKRVQVEYGGLMIDGQPWDSEEKDELRLNSMLKLFEITGDAEFDGWKIADGVYITLTKTQAEAAAVAFMRHYAHAFTVEGVKAAEIDALTSAAEIEAWLQNNLNIGWEDNNNGNVN